jgi:hypothetical protein
MQPLERGTAQGAQIECFIIDLQVKNTVAKLVTFTAPIARHISPLLKGGKSTMNHALRHPSRAAELRYATGFNPTDKHLQELQNSLRRLVAVTVRWRVS